MDAAESNILILPAPSWLAQDNGSKGILDAAVRPLDLNSELLRENIKSFIESANTLLSGVPEVTDPFRLDEIELTIEIIAEGNLQLIGGAKAGASGGTTLRMKR